MFVEFEAYNLVWLLKLFIIGNLVEVEKWYYKL